MPHAIQNLFYPLYRAAHWPDEMQLQHERRAFALQTLLDAVDLSSVHTVLEIGCGDGWVSNELGRHFPRVIGFDINPARIQARHAPNVTLAACTAENPCIRPGSVDLIVSLSLLEHLPRPVETLLSLASLLSEEGRMVHMVPHWGWKVLQFAGYYPNIVRKHTQSILRALAGRPKCKRAKYYTGRETNNPGRISRRVWHHKFYPRIHGEYDSHLAEILAWRPAAWRQLFEAADLAVMQQIPMGIGSPYYLGVSRYLRPMLKRRCPCATTFVLKRRVPNIETVPPSRGAGPRVSKAA